MAEEIFCPVCETPNEAWNELCEACGAELHAHADEEALEADSEPADFEGFEDVGEAAELTDDTGVDRDALEADEVDDAADEWEEDNSQEVAYELAAIEENQDEEFFGDEDSDEDEFAGEESFEEQPFDEDAELEFEDDEFAADGGTPTEPEIAAEFHQEEVGFDDEFAADGEADSEVGFDDEEFDEELAAESEPEEEPPAPPELEAILNPEHVEREPITPLPEPGPYTEPAVLAVFKAGEQLGEVAIDFDCTVLGLDDGSPSGLPDDPGELDFADMEPIEPIEDEPDAVAYELEAIDEDEEPSDQEAFEDEFGDGEFGDELALEDEADAPEEEFGFEEQDSDPFDEDTPVSEMSDVSEVSEVAAASEAYEEPADVEEGPVVDLAQFGEASAFATRHGYVFRQNKNYTLYVISDRGTQLNDEVLTLGEHRKLADGDVIVLGGEVALRFDEPAA